MSSYLQNLPDNIKSSFFPACVGALQAPHNSTINLNSLSSIQMADIYLIVCLQK